MNKEIIDYIKESKEKGFSLDDIRKALLEAGWNEKDIEQAIDSTLQAPKTSKNKNKKILVVGIIIIAVLIVVGLVIAFYPDIKGLFEKSEEAVEEQGEKSEYQDCGRTDMEGQVLVEGFAQGVFESDATLVCLGKNFLNGCKKSKATIETDEYGEAKFYIEGQRGADCIVKVEYGDAAQILEEEDKILANKFIECPINIEKDIKETAERDWSQTPGSLMPGILLHVGFSIWVEETRCTGSAFQSRSEIAQKDIFTGQTTYEGDGIYKSVGIGSSIKTTNQKYILEITGMNEEMMAVYINLYSKDNKGDYIFTNNITAMKGMIIVPEAEDQVTVCVGIEDFDENKVISAIEVSGDAIFSGTVTYEGNGPHDLAKEGESIKTDDDFILEIFRVEREKVLIKLYDDDYEFGGFIEAPEGTISTAEFMPKILVKDVDAANKKIGSIEIDNIEW